MAMKHPDRFGERADVVIRTWNGMPAALQLSDRSLDADSGYQLLHGVVREACLEVAAVVTEECAFVADGFGRDGGTIRKLQAASNVDAQDLANTVQRHAQSHHNEQLRDCIEMALRQAALLARNRAVQLARDLEWSLVDDTILWGGTDGPSTNTLKELCGQ